MSKNSCFWFPFAGSSSNFKPSEISLAWIHRNKNLCVIHTWYFCSSDGLVSTPVVLFSFIRTLVDWESYFLRVLFLQPVSQLILGCWLTRIIGFSLSSRWRSEGGWLFCLLNPPSFLEVWNNIIAGSSFPFW